MVIKLLIEIILNQKKLLLPMFGAFAMKIWQKAISEMNKDAKSKTIFHWMTVSNHRPYTYPEGKMTFRQLKSRNGGVKYTDYALKKFFEWRLNKIGLKYSFVIVADHCASSAGKTELPMDKYRIPGMIFSPGFVEPQKFRTVTSQIDIMPTLLLVTFQL